MNKLSSPKRKLIKEAVDFAQKMGVNVADMVVYALEDPQDFRKYKKDLIKFAAYLDKVIAEGNL